MGVWFTLIFQWYGLYNVTNIVVIDRGNIQDNYIHNENKMNDYNYDNSEMVMVTIVWGSESLGDCITTGLYQA